MTYGLGLPELIVTYVVAHAPIIICIVVAVIAIVWLLRRDHQ
jgi:hypothetical protein